ncbi:hypothetical protein H0H92_014685 [Tricholoma furcatifolium]|nr:hypothetical protein H0H92_014685 [Tricholoma furcatifolium]
MAAFNNNPPTSFDVSPSTHTRAHNDSNPHLQVPMDYESSTEPQTPSLKRVSDKNIDPSLFTPTKRMRSLYTALCSTSSGSFLVSKAPLTSATPIIQTVHHKAQNMIIEGAHAQLVVQNLHLQKLNGALHKKETRKKNDRALLLDEKAQVLSSDEFLAQLTHQVERQEEEAAQRARNAETRASKREVIAHVEEEWMRIKEAHAANVSAWETECQKLGLEGVPKKE